MKKLKTTRNIILPGAVVSPMCDSWFRIQMQAIFSEVNFRVSRLQVNR